MGDQEGFSDGINSETKAANKDKKLLNCIQTVKFGSDPVESHDLCCTDVRIMCSPGTHTSGSSNVKLKNIVDFNWDLKTYPGQLIAVHIRGNILAYGLKTMGKGESPGSVSGIVRVVSRNNNQRTLIRGLRGMVQDLAFSHLQNVVVLACVDQQGVLMVHRIEEKASEISCTLLLHVDRDDNKPSPPVDVHRVIWCPYIPDEGGNTSGDSEAGQLLVLTRGPYAEMWCVPLVHACHGPGPILPSQVTQGLLQVPKLESTIADAAFSPDGTALAIATSGGLVSFFQVYMHNHAIPPRCLHSWRPHGYNPLTTLYFLDNHKDYSPDIQFWKWAITGSRDNSEIKLWACESWNCLQTINFEPSPDPISPTMGDSSPPRSILKAAIDLSSRYIVLSDIYNRMLYVLQLHLDKGPAHVSMVSGFTLPQPALSFGIFEAGVRVPGNSHDHQDGPVEDGFDFEDEMTEAVRDVDDDDESSQSFVMLRMFVVQPKSLQECSIAFRPIAKPPTLSHDTLVFHEESTVNQNGDSSELPNNTTAAAAADLPANQVLSTNKSTPVAEAINTSSNMLNTSGGLNLMTPDAFSSPARHEDSPSRASNVSSSGGSVKRSTHTPPPPQDLPQPSQLTPQIKSEEEVLLLRDGAMASGGSSPSREVQQILALQDNGDLVDDFFEGKSEPLTDPLDNSIPEAAAGTSGAAEVQESSTYEWPQIPLVMMPMEESKPKSESLSSVPVPPAPVLVPTEEFAIELRSIQNSLQSLTMILEKQQNDFKDFRNDITRLATMHEALQSSTAAAIEQTLTHQLQRQSQMMDNVVHEKLNEMRDTLISSFVKSLDNTMANRVSQMLSKEVKSQLLPVTVSTLQQLQEILHTEVAKKLTMVDHQVQENISRLVSSKALQETLSATLSNTLLKVMQASFRDVLTTHTMPVFERLCKSLFTQLNETFSRGTREYMSGVEAQVDKQRQRQSDKARDMNAQITALSDSVRAGNDATANLVVTEMNTAMAKIALGLQESIGRAARETVAEAIARAMREQSTVAMRVSRPQTPQPRSDPQAQMATVMALAHQGQLNSAFQQALSASDLSLVVTLCERVTPHQVFNQIPCHLQQPVLLSLIQQLSADLNSNTELKETYLREAVMNLDTDNTNTREHLPSVLLPLQKQLSAYVQNNPNKQVTKNMRMLLMATQALIKH